MPDETTTMSAPTITIRGVQVIDGSGAAAFQADVVVAEGRIARLARQPLDLADVSGPVIDGAGLTLAPGFIDLHSHADFTLPAYPSAVNSIAQGVTTEVLGNCGFSPAPLAPDGDVRDATIGISQGISGPLDWDWTSFSEYLERLENARPTVNCVPLVGHNALRVAAMGGIVDRRPTTGETAEMQRLLADALEAGAWGMSTGLVYTPGAYAQTQEVLDLGEVLGQHGALYASHMRNEGPHLVEAVEETIAIGEQSGVRVQVSHLKAVGRESHGRVGPALALIEAANKRGVAVNCDVYPYNAGATFLRQLLPPWSDEGGVEALLERLDSPTAVERLRHEVTTGLPGWVSQMAAAGGWDGVMILNTGRDHLRHYEGRTVKALADQASADPFDLVVDLLRQTRTECTMAVFVMDPEDVATVVRHPLAGFGSDQFGVTDRHTQTHPRSYGTFARLLSREYREEVGLELEEAVRKMTSLPADILGLADRGRLTEGGVADLVLFDAHTVRERSTYADPTVEPEGIEGVYLRGHQVVAGGEVLTPTMGSVIRRRATNPGV